MGTGEIPLLEPVTRSVSASISKRISSKSVNFFPLQCRNSPYSVGTEAESQKQSHEWKKNKLTARSLIKCPGLKRNTRTAEGMKCGNEGSFSLDPMWLTKKLLQPQLQQHLRESISPKPSQSSSGLRVCILTLVHSKNNLRLYWYEASLTHTCNFHRWTGKYLCIHKNLEQLCIKVVGVNNSCMTWWEQTQGSL